MFLFPSLKWELRDGQFDFPCAYTRDRNGSCVAPISVFLELKGRDICAWDSQKNSCKFTQNGVQKSKEFGLGKAKALPKRVLVNVSEPLGR